MGIGSFLFRRRSKGLGKKDEALRLQVASSMQTFLSIRGIRFFMRPETALVMRKGYETFVTSDVDKVENRQNIVALVYLKDVECYEQFKEIQTDPVLRGSALGQISLGHLADQVATQVAKQASEATKNSLGLRLVFRSDRAKEITVRRT
jgi:hypothetical protein